MNLQYLALKKGKEKAGHRIKFWVKQGNFTRGFSNATIYHGPSTSSPARLRADAAKEHVKELSDKQKARKDAKALDRDFFLSVLNSSATKRDARSYLQRFTPSKDAQTATSALPSESKAQASYVSGVNLGGFYGTARAVAESPKFVQQPERRKDGVNTPRLHIALVKIRNPQCLSDDTLYGIGRTISQLGRLGLTSVVVVDCGFNNNATELSASSRLLVTEQAERMVVAIDAHGKPGARLVNNVIEVSEENHGVGSSLYLRGKAHVTMRNLLITPLRRGIIAVIPALGYTDANQTSLPVSADEIVLALTREFAGIAPVESPDEDPAVIRERMQAVQKEVSLDRLILLDPLGGIPASDRPNGYHVFLNMEQEFESAKQDLSKNTSSHGGALKRDKWEACRSSNYDHGNSFPAKGTEFIGQQKDCDIVLRTPDLESHPEIAQHLENLKLVRSVLLLLPPSSSALLTTPNEAANSGKQPDTPFQAAGVGTRRQRNPLIHNLLTDKPVFSSSLPVGRLGPTASSPTDKPLLTLSDKITPTTFAKHGMSVTIFPDPRTTPWEPPTPGRPQLTLTHPRIDLPRLVHLIEDSFGRTLDVEDYLKRVNGRIAGVIIAGEYEGGALLTWETPQGVIDDGSPESRARMVPYLDKFAVLKRSQGSGGTADVVFKAMVRDCFPEGVCWRSRKTNVVNKWYFERSRGTWKLPDTGWTMFWTTPDLSLDQQKFRDYESVCKGVAPSWSDNKAILD